MKQMQEDGKIEKDLNKDVIPPNPLEGGNGGYKVPEDWMETTLGDVAEIVTDYVANGSFASLKDNVTYLKNGYARLIRLVDRNRNYSDDAVFVSENSYNFLKKSKLFPNDIVISNVGEYSGTVFRVPNLKIPMTLGPNAILIRFGNSNDFMYYFLTSSLGQHLVNSIKSGSANPKFNKTDFKNIKFLLPPLPEQQAIASVLSAFDDKIELLREQNKTLEEMGQTIFKVWFYPLAPSEGEFEDKSEVETVDSCNEDNGKKYLNWKLELNDEDVKARGLIWDGIHFPYNPNNVEKAKIMRANMTTAESILWNDFLKNHEFKFYRQRPIDHFIVDFFCSKADLVIEIDGCIHNSENAKDYDEMRTQLLNIYGLKVIRFTNDEIMNDFEKVCEEINSYLYPSKSLLEGESSSTNSQSSTKAPYEGVGGNLPKGWRVGKLGEEFDITIGRTPPRVESQWFSYTPTGKKWISIKDIGNSGTFIFDTSEYLTDEAIEKFNIPVIPENTTILSFKMTVGKLTITTEEMVSNEAIAHLKLKNDSVLSSEYIYSFLQNLDFNALGSTSSIVTAINSTMIKNLEVIIPDQENLKQFDEAIQPIFAKIRDNSEQIKSLGKSRDELLPRLMRGEVRVKF